MATTGKPTRLNGICPYFTMFPLDFPYDILGAQGAPGEWVLDPFCGRGTTLYAARLLGMPSVGIDSNPVAATISEAKLVSTTPDEILEAAHQVLEGVESPHDVPTGEFWDWAFHPVVLDLLCRLREGLLSDCSSASRKALRAILMGALHGPRPKGRPAYLSNQSPRTYAPKPRYAVGYWKSRNLAPERVEVLRIIEERAQRYYSEQVAATPGAVVCGDSRERITLTRPDATAFKWVITSPPYYGLKTYRADQWLRLWFVGGKAEVDYSTDHQLAHRSTDVFASDLRTVWRNAASVAASDARMVVRFGSINDRSLDPLSLVQASLEDSGWNPQRVEAAGTAAAGRRQALHFSTSRSRPLQEVDVWATRVR